MKKRSVKQSDFSWVAVAGLVISIAGAINPVVDGEASRLSIVLILTGFAILAIGLVARTSRPAYRFIASTIDPKIVTIETCPEHHVGEVHALACEFFGNDVTHPDKIKEIQTKYRDGLQVALKKDASGTVRVHGYFFMFPINKTCVDNIERFKFDVGELSATDIATKPRYGYAVYVGGIAGKGFMVRREILGALKYSSSLVRDTKTQTAYARAATDRGLSLLRSNGFEPVHPEADNVGCFYRRHYSRAQ